MEEIYRLKGSTHGRFVAPPPAVDHDALAKPKSGKLDEKQNVRSIINQDTKFVQENRKFRFYRSLHSEAYLVRVKRDVAFLEKIGVMNYSLLVGIRAGGAWEAGITDILTPYDTKKKWEHALAGALFGFKVMMEGNETCSST